MTDTNEQQLSAIKKFRTLHESGCFVMPNPWDAGTSRYLQHLGFEALATTSAGFAFSRGLPDSASAIERYDMIGHIREIVQATSLPVNADFQNGFADDPQGVADNVNLCIATGVAGLSIEDSSETVAGGLYESSLAVDRIKAARAAIDASGVPVVLTARAEVYLVGAADPLSVALDRLVAFADAGADCLYAPGVTDPEQIRTIVKAVAPKPVNVLVSRPNNLLSVARLTDLGVRRISVGSGLAMVAWGSFIRAAQTLKESGSFEDFAGGASYAELNGLFGPRTP
ncbi:MAG TPA: isocitrate lyase/phosphoenolpyruvate mutase family protein [Pyrinomonadaceae bacterium]|nr:isocitrate lyase/phosphoenolpyruvate mutase family protein [Pyrinomonadaceae bacterium]